MAQYVFGTGGLFINPVGGGASLKFASLLDVSVDISGDIKEMNGQYTFAQSVARGKSKIQCKATSGQFDVNLFNSTFFGQTVATGCLVPVISENHSVPATSAYTVTATNGSTFAQDMGVYYGATGLPLTQVSSGPTLGQYSVNSTTGVYTFAAADASAAVVLSYLYTSSSSGHNLVVANQLMGSAPTFQCTLMDSFNDNGTVKSVVMQLYSNTASKLSLPLKADDYLQVGFEWQAQANAAGNVFYLSQTT